MPSIKACLEHRHSYVRKNAALAVYHIHKHFGPTLIPDGAELMERFISTETELGSRRNAFLMLFNEAEEIAIESFAKAFDQLDRFDEKLSFNSWLITIAKNHHTDLYRKSKHQMQSSKEVEEDKTIEFSRTAPSPEELMIANQNLDRVLGHIKSMKKEFRNLLKMRYFDDLSLKEIEDKLDEPATTIRVKLFRAKKMLANLLESEKN